MSNELIVLSHNDLDCLGSVLNIEFKMPHINKKYFFTNYGDLDKVVDELEEYAVSNNIKHILMPDVSFADNKDALRRIYKLGSCTHIDHHQYAEGFWDEFPNMKVIHDQTKSATKLCNIHFKNEGKNLNLDKLSYLIDVYDIWRVKNPHFDVAQSLNDYFWTYDLMELVQRIMSNDFKLPGDFFQVTANIKKTYEAEIASYEDRKLIHRYGKLTMAFSNDWFNQILIKEMKNGQNVVIGATSWGLIRTRISEDAPFSDEQKKQMMKEITGADNIGHVNAFTHKIQGKVDFTIIMDEIERVVNSVHRITR